jgi:small subunit ribosomal protein S4
LPAAEAASGVEAKGNVMARYLGSACRLCRREGTKLFLKGDRCFSEKCAIEKRAYPPGQHGQGRTRFSDYGVQLREKQKVKRMYCLLEHQFRTTFDRASRMKGRAGENLLVLLERRLDNVVFRMGFATSRNEARQLVRHGHFMVDGKKVSTPSIQVRPGQRVSVREKSQQIVRIAAALEALEGRAVPQWIEMDKGTFSGTMTQLPSREDITLPIEEQLIVELYSR